MIRCAEIRGRSLGVIIHAIGGDDTVGDAPAAEKIYSPVKLPWRSFSGNKQYTVAEPSVREAPLVGVCPAKSVTASPVFVRGIEPPQRGSR